MGDKKLSYQGRLIELRSVRSQFKIYRDWHEEFYERLDATYPEIVKEILDKMGGGMDGEDALSNEMCGGEW